MIRGIISNHRPYIPLTLRGPSGYSDVEFVLDTGFSGMLTLPLAACVALGLSFARIQPSRLADGTRILLDICEATLDWDGGQRIVHVLGVDGPPLIGMALLDGYDVHLRVQDGGSVTVESIPPAGSDPSAE